MINKKGQRQTTTEEFHERPLRLFTTFILAQAEYEEDSPIQPGSVCQEAGTVPATPAIIGRKAGPGKFITQPPSNSNSPAPASQDHKTRHLERQNASSSPKKLY
ncbi:hypothetical protein CSPAE12_06862 [Colletotrichum incanum]|nr:hypothetical protein CSPAE12_06862 [Colletotrichum incanum]